MNYYEILISKLLYLYPFSYFHFTIYIYRSRVDTMLNIKIVVHCSLLSRIKKNFNYFLNIIGNYALIFWKNDTDFKALSKLYNLFHFLFKKHNFKFRDESYCILKSMLKNFEKIWLDNLICTNRTQKNSRKSNNSHY